MTELMIPVERVVRPVRACGARKDRMREDLLTHLTAAYEQERAALGDDRLALTRAVARLGDPAALTRDLQATVTGLGRLDAAFEHWVGWWGGESATRFLARAAGLLFLSTAGLFTLAAVAGFGSPDPDRWFRFRLVVAMVFAMSASLVPMGLVYFEIRGAVCGGLGKTRSPARAALWATLAGLLTATSGSLFCVLGGVAPADALGLFLLSLPAGVLVAVLFVGLARVNGPKEIRHTEWECLNVAD